MTVVGIGVDYEGSKVLGVFHTLDVAKLFIEAHCKTKASKFHDYYNATVFADDGVSKISSHYFNMDGVEDV